MRIVEFLREEPYLVARVQRLPEVVEESVEVDALTRNTLELFQRLVALVAHMPDELVTAALNVDDPRHLDRKSTRLNSSHANISYAVFCLKKKKNIKIS